jgi:hypothetical protein
MGKFIEVIAPVGAIIIGMFIIAGGQLFLAIREIALNTRKMSSSPEGDQYNALKILAKIAVIIGVIVIVIGATAFVSAIENYRR